MSNKLGFISFIAQVKLLFKTQRMDSIGRVLSLPSVIFDFDCSPLGTSFTFSTLFVVAVVAADVVVVGVIFPCSVKLVAVVMVVAVLVLGLLFWLTVDFMLIPPTFDFFCV